MGLGMVSGVIALALAPDHASRDFYATSAQIIPVILLALAVDSRLLRVDGRVPPSPEAKRLVADIPLMKPVLRALVASMEAYRVFVGAMLVFGELTALGVLTHAASAEHSENGDVVFSAITMGLIALAVDAVFFARGDVSR
jgi:hypothetical protein